MRLLRNRARLPRDIPTPGSNEKVTAARADHERMPARSAARFEGDEVLVTQLVDDLARGDAALRRPARDEDLTAGPGGQVGQRSCKRRLLRRRGGAGRRP